MSRHGRLTEERVRKVATPNLTLSEAACRLGVQPSSLGKWKRRLGLSLRPGPGAPSGRGVSGLTGRQNGDSE